MRFPVLLICGLVASCASYGNGHEPETCSTVADCNPGKDCGDLVQCIDGKCDPGQTTHVPCSMEDDWYACEEDSDCTRVQVTCCECEYGYPDIGINREYEDEYMSELMEFCIRADVYCPGYDACTDHQAVCHQGRCVMIYEQCGCEETWDPVCMGANAAGVWVTVRNECVADCQGIEWDYHGRCDCAVECFVADPVCAENGVTYWCGEPEANCSGQQVDYDGECQ